MAGLSAKNSGLIWFGAAVSMAEIITGTWLAPLGWQQGVLAILLGHFIGGLLFFGAAYIGAKTDKSAMQTVQISFGQKGAMLFSVANVLQLIGWTAIMIYSGALVSNTLSQSLWDFDHFTLWVLLIGLFIVLWLVFGSRQIGGLKIISLVAMLAIVLWLSMKVFNAENLTLPAGEMRFGTAVELSAVMPLSWLPLVADYTRNAKSPRNISFIAALTYGLTSSWMYLLGLGAVLFTGQSDIAQILRYAGISVAGIAMVLLSTITTTFLDAYSAGVSANTISAKLPETSVAIGVALLGTLLAISLPVTEYEHFLLLIGSVFAPMIAILLTDFFLLYRRENTNATDVVSLILWLMGFVLYRYLLAIEWESVLGLTAPVMFATGLLTFIVRKGMRRGIKRNE